MEKAPLIERYHSDIREGQWKKYIPGMYRKVKGFIAE
jgi:hypothetical protein